MIKMTFGNFAITKFDDVIYVCNRQTDQTSTFDATTGAKIVGDINWEPEEVLYRAWRQTQPHMSESKLQAKWDNMKSS